MDFLTLDKIFVLDNLNIVLDKKYFVQADGQGMRHKKVDWQCILDYISIFWLEYHPHWQSLNLFDLIKTFKAQFVHFSNFFL